MNRAAQAEPTSGGEHPQRPSHPDGEYRALLALAELVRQPKPKEPLGELEAIAHLARELTNARFAALGVTDERDRMEGFVTSGIDEKGLPGLKTPPQGHGLLGSLRHDGKPVRIDDVDRHPQGFGFPPQHPAMRSLLGVPLWGQGEVRGSLYVTDRDGGQPFTDNDEAVLLTLSRHAQHIIENEWH